MRASLEGFLEMKMKDAESEKPYSVFLEPHQAGLTGQGTYLELIAREPCREESLAATRTLSGPPVGHWIGVRGQKTA